MLASVKNSIYLLVATVLIVATFFWRPHALDAKRLLISPPPNIEFFTFGHREVIADVLWIRAIQDFDYCEDKIEASINCSGNGWLYKLLDTITNLSPRFRIAYATGALALSIVVSDIEGASKIFDKAVNAYPNDYRIVYSAAYHALFEEKNNVKAGELMERAARNGGQPWMFSLASRLYSEAGHKELGLRVYNELKANPNTDPVLLKRMREKLGIPD